MLHNARKEFALPKLADRVLIEGGVNSSFTINSKFSDLSLLATFHRILSHLEQHFLNGQFFCLRMKRTSCSEVSVDSQISIITTSQDLFRFQLRKTVFLQFADKKLLCTRQFF